LNQLLVEMAGFDARQSVIVLTATNRADVLDPTLLLPGRFDRRVIVQPPDWRGRAAILKVHTRGVPLASSVGLGDIAAETPGLVSGLLACLTGLLLVATGMRLLTRDPLLIAEYAARGPASGAPDLATYVAYETLAGALGHLLVLGLAMGALLGALGGLLGRGLAAARPRAADRHGR
jgi:hypothetical protein